MGTTAIIIIVVLVVIALTFMYTTRNLYKTNSKLEVLINNREEWIVELSARINYIKNRLDVIDKTGHFEADDEVGYFFVEIKEMTEMLNDMLELDETEVSKNASE